MNSPPQGPRRNVLQAIRTLNNLLTAKLHGDHMLFPSEQALNASIKAHIHVLRTHPELHAVFRRFKQEYGSWF